MERSWDTIRELMLRVDDCSVDSAVVTADFSADRGAELVHHVRILLEGKLIDADIINTLEPGDSRFQIFRLTWAGHELLDTIRNDTVWNQTKLFFQNQQLGFTYKAVLSVARQLNESLM